MEVLGKRLKQARMEKGFRPSEVAKKINMAYHTYMHYERARHEPSLETLIILAKLFDCSVDWLLGLEEERKK